MAKKRAKKTPARRKPARRRSLDTRSLAHENSVLGNELRSLRDREHSLERSRASYVELFDFSPVAYALLDSVGLVLNISMAGCRLLGHDRRRIVGSPLLTFVVDEDRRELMEHLRRARQGGTTVESEIRLRAPGGKPVTCRLYSKAAVYEEIAALPTMIVDQTETRALDQARLAAERSKEVAERQASIAQASNIDKDRFLAMVSHELRTPLSPALVAASRLAAWDEMPDPARLLAATIKRNIELEARLIDDLLDIARVSEGKLQLAADTVDLHQVLRETLKICSPAAELRQVTITMHQVARAHYVTGDASRLRQVFWNLLNNALKFARPNGAIVVRSGNVDRHIRVTVRDDGEGMDNDVQQALFKSFTHRPFRASGRSGLGLGLAISMGIVRAHGGHIWGTSDGPGLGSTFGVELETVDPASAVTTAAESATSVADQRDTQVSNARSGALNGRARVLLVEDDADSGEMLAMLLSAEGFEVEVAASLGEAIPRLGEDWDVVLSDLSLPDGSGHEIARCAKALNHPPSQVIALSGFGSHNDIEASLKAGFDRHLVKPVDPDKLLELIAAAAASHDR